MCGGGGGGGGAGIGGGDWLGVTDCDRERDLDLRTNCQLLNRFLLSLNSNETFKWAVTTSVLCFVIVYVTRQLVERVTK